MSWPSKKASSSPSSRRLLKANAAIVFTCESDAARATSSSPTPAQVAGAWILFQMERPGKYPARGNDRLIQNPQSLAAHSGIFALFVRSRVAQAITFLSQFA